MNANAARAAFEAATPLHPPLDSTVLSAGRRTPPAFPATLLPPAVWALAKDLAEGTSTPVDYVGCAMLAATATAIGGSRRVRAFEGQTWTEPCILWVGAVGDPSSGKSPAIEAAIEPLRDIERDLAVGFADTLRAWETDELSAKLNRDTWAATVKDANKEGQAVPTLPESAVAPVKPSRPRLMVQDATPESVAAVLGSNSRLLCYRDELAGWFTSFDRYSPGGRTQWLESYGGRPLTVDRKGADAPATVPFNGVSVLGGIQPEKLATVFAGEDDGLAARFIWTWPRSVPYRRPRCVGDTHLWPMVLRRLVDMRYAVNEAGNPCPVVLTLDADAADLFEAWRITNGDCAHDGGGLFKSFVGKLPGLLLRLALVLELMDWALCGGDEPNAVSAVTLLQAREFIDAYCKPMALRVFGDAALPVAERNAATLARHIIRTKARRLNLREVLRLRLPGLNMADPLGDAADILEDAGWLIASGKRSGDTPGRRSKDYSVNPLAHTQDHGVIE